jgi:hypothetical protein
MRFPVLVLAVFSFFPSAIALQADEFLRIDSPAANETVSGSVEIIGAAAAPGMMRFRVEFAYDPNPSETWFLITEETEPVTAGLLATWDTSLITPGDYALRVAAYFSDGSENEAVTHGIRVRHGSSPASTPSIEGVTPIAPEPQTYGKAVGAFPAPTAAAAANPAAASGETSKLGNAFLVGVILVFLGFGLAGIRSRWLWWKRRRFARQIRKNERKHG